MKLSFTRAGVYRNGHFVFKDDFFLIGNSVEVSADTDFSNPNIFVFPGFVDVHVHLREPGFSYKETVSAGTLAASAGGFCAVCTMPNLDPVPDCLENLKVQLDIIERDAAVKVVPFGAITVGEGGERLSDMESMAPYVAGFSDDGRGVQSAAVMRSAMEKARSLGKVISAHCEDNSLLHDGYIHDGAYARAHGYRGISSESEWRQIERDVELCAQTGCAYHVCHISTAKSLDIIRQAKKSGLDVTCETAPHYLVLSEDDIREDGRFKMNPPLRTPDDRDALVEGLADGSIDMVATDHAPHSREEKSRGLEGSLMGVVGLECAFPVLYTKLVKTGKLTLERLTEAMSTAPARRFGIDTGGAYAVFDLGEAYTVDPEKFRSKGRATPFDADTVYGKHIATLTHGQMQPESREA